MDSATEHNGKGKWKWNANKMETKMVLHATETGTFLSTTVCHICLYKSRAHINIWAQYMLGKKQN